MQPILMVAPCTDAATADSCIRNLLY